MIAGVTENSPVGTGPYKPTWPTRIAFAMKIYLPDRLDGETDGQRDDRFGQAIMLALAGERLGRERDRKQEVTWNQTTQEK